MSKTSLRNVQGWTPVIDSIIEKHGLTTALVFGIIWRHCQMDGHTCYASQETLAQAIKMTRQTVIIHADILVSDGYLEKIERIGHPSVYKDTGKAGLSIEAFDRGVSQDDTPPDGGVRQTDTGCKPALQGVSSSLTGGVSLPYTNKTINTPIKTPKNKTKKAPDGAATKPPLYPIAQALATVTGEDLTKNKGRIFKEAKLYQPEDLQKIQSDYGQGGLWYSCDWRGLRGQPPTLSQIRETWNNLKAPIQQGKNGNGHLPPVVEDPAERAKIDAAFSKG